MNRTFWATVFIVVFSAAIITSVISQLSKDDHPGIYTNPDSAFSFGVMDPAAFSNMQGAWGPEFTAEVHNDFTWTLNFIAGAYVDSDKFSPYTYASGFPDIVVLFPLDAFNCRPFGTNNATDEAAKYFASWSMVAYNKPVEHQQVYTLRPTYMEEQSSKRKMIVWGISCDTRSFGSTSAGIDARHFELQYIPGRSAQLGLTPGIGSRADLTISYRPSLDLQSGKLADGVETNFDALDPQPMTTAHSQAAWTLGSNDTISIRGTTTSWWISWWERRLNWLYPTLGTALFAALLALVWPKVFGSAQVGKDER